METRRKYKARWVITIISFVMSLVMFGAFLFNIFTRPGETTDTLGSFDYAIGAIDDSGKIIESKQSVYSKKLHTVDELDIEVAEDATVSYVLYFYDADEKFIEASDVLTDDVTEASVPENAEFFRIVITPAEVDGEAVVLSIFNTGKYINQVKVSFAKD